MDAVRVVGITVLTIPLPEVMSMETDDEVDDAVAGGVADVMAVVDALDTCTVVTSDVRVGGDDVASCTPVLMKRAVQTICRENAQRSTLRPMGPFYKNNPPATQIFHISINKYHYPLLLHNQTNLTVFL